MVRRLSGLLCLIVLMGCADIDQALLVGQWQAQSIEPDVDSTIDIHAVQMQFDSLYNYSLFHYGKEIESSGYSIERHALVLEQSSDKNKIHVLKQLPDTLWLRFLSDTVETTVRLARVD